MKRRIVISLVGGFCFTVALALLSAFLIKFAPYRDLPMMPMPFFLVALSPGILAAEMIERPHWIHESAFWVVNTFVYGIGVFAVCSVLHLWKIRPNHCNAKSILDRT